VTTKPKTLAALGRQPPRLGGGGKSDDMKHQAQGGDNSAGTSPGGKKPSFNRRGLKKKGEKKWLRLEGSNNAAMTPR